MLDGDDLNDTASNNSLSESEMGMTVTSSEPRDADNAAHTAEISEHTSRSRSPGIALQETAIRTAVDMTEHPRRTVKAAAPEEAQPADSAIERPTSLIEDDEIPVLKSRSGRVIKHTRVESDEEDDACADPHCKETGDLEMVACAGPACGSKV
jgi:hypothetical protein